MIKRKYIITFEVEIFEDQYNKLNFHLAESVHEKFGVYPEGLIMKRILSEDEKLMMSGACVNSQAVDQYYEGCRGCIECQRKWLKQLGWEEKDIPDKPFSLLGFEEVK